MIDNNCDSKNSNLSQNSTQFSPQRKSIFKDGRFWIGIGSGAVISGLVTGFSVSSSIKKKERRRSANEIKKAKEKMQAYIDENSIEIEGCSQEDLVNSLKEALKNRSESSLTIENGKNGQDNGQNRVSEAKNESSDDDKSDKKLKNDDAYAEPGTIPIKNEETSDFKVEKIGNADDIFPWKISGREYLVQLKDGGTISYPIELFCDQNGLMDVMKIRSNLRIYEKNPANLKRVWEALGWGNFDPITDDGFPNEEDLNNWDLSINDVSKMLEECDKDDPEEVTIEKERWKDKLDKYRNDPSVGQPKIVSRRRFEEDNMLKHIYVDYYDVDNVFTDNEDMNSEIDPTMLFGVANGNDLFEYKKNHPFDPDDDDNDPEIVHVENFADQTIAEITRYHRSYQSVRDGSAYFDGGSGKVGRN